MPDPLDLEELERLHEAATPGWWTDGTYAGEVVDRGGRMVTACHKATDADLVVALRNAWPVLYDRIRTAEATEATYARAIGERDAALRDAAALRQALAELVHLMRQYVSDDGATLEDEEPAAFIAARALLATGADPTDGAE